MTIQAQPDAPVSTAIRRAPVGWIVFVVVLASFVVFVLASMRTGVADDPRIANPNPGPAPYPISPFLDPVPFTIMSISQSVVLFSVLLWMSWRRRKLHWAAVIAIGAIFTGLIDPIANWATFASLNPQVPHLPTEWPWVRLAPLSEPASAFLGGYASYYLAIGGMSYWLAHRLVIRRAAPGSVVSRRPLLSLFVAAWIISFPFNAIFQLAWMQIGMLVYTQFAGPVLHVGHLQLPLLILFYDPFVYATLAILIVRNDQGESQVLSTLAQRIPARTGRPRNTSGRRVAVAGMVMIASILLPITGFAAIRALGLADNVVYDEWPFPETKVPDPYGVLEEDGKPGPFLK
jgi:hypothetical protein